MYKNIPGFKVYCNAEGGAAGGEGGAPAAQQTVGDVAAANSGGSSASVPSMPSAPAAGATPDFKTSLGDYGKDAMFADFKDVSGLAKAYKDTKTLVGQKLGIPDENATPEAKAAFEKAIGVPESPEGYGFKKPENWPNDIEYDEAHAAAWAQRFKENGVPAKVANALRDAFMAESFEAVKKQQEGASADKTKADENFDEVTKKAFGDKRDAQLQQARTDIERYGSKELRELVNEVPNSALALIAQVVTGIRTELGGEDNVITGDSGGGAQSEAELRGQLREIMAKPEYSSPFVKGKDETARLVKEAKEISNKIAALQQAQQVKK